LAGGYLHQNQTRETNLDSENFYVLEDWVVDKTRGETGVTGFVGGIHGYQLHVIQGLEQIVKYLTSGGVRLT